MGISNVPSFFSNFIQINNFTDETWCILDKIPLL